MSARVSESGRDHLHRGWHVVISTISDVWFVLLQAINDSITPPIKHRSQVHLRNLEFVRIALFTSLMQRGRIDRHQRLPPRRPSRDIRWMSCPTHTNQHLGVWNNFKNLYLKTLQCPDIHVTYSARDVVARVVRPQGVGIVAWSWSWS